MAANLTKRAVIVAGYKGGTGKTFFARALLDRWRRDGRNVLAMDGDGKVGQLLQYYGARDDAGRLLPDQPPTGVQYFDARADRTRVIDVLDTPSDRILIDLPGGVLGELAAAIGGEATAADVVGEYNREGYAVTIALVLSPMLASARSVKDAMIAFGPTADLAIVLSAAFGDTTPDGDFLYWYGFDDGTGQRRGGASRAEALERGAKEITLPALRPRIVAQLDAENLTFSAAQDHASLTRSARTHVRQWVRDTDVVLDKSRVFLGLS